jgi:microcystin-dependent protein
MDLLHFKFRPNGGTVNGKVYTYRAGTYITKATYPTKTDATNETNANANPVILDARGEASIFVKGPTKVVLKDSDDSLLWTADNFDAVSDNILDANGNELLTFYSVLGGVNNLHMTNAATGQAPIFSAVGTDANIGLGVAAKGTGKVKFPIGNLTITSGNLTISAGDLNLTAGDINLTSGDVNITSGGVSVEDTSSAFNILPVGLVTWNASFTVPVGWLECNGAAVSRTTYATLFSAIGTTYGTGDGSTTFNLPAQARRTLVGKGGSGTATLANTIGSTGGAETHTLTTSQLPSHTHTYDATSTTGGWEGYVGPDPFHLIQYLNYTYPSLTTTATGGGADHNIMQPSLVAMMIIRAY